MRNILRLLRKIYNLILNSSKGEYNLPGTIKDPELASDIIYNALISDKPIMIARFGSTELSCLSNYLNVKCKNKKYWKFIKGDIAAWWWDENIVSQMQIWSGFFPPTINKLENFSNYLNAPF